MNIVFINEKDGKVTLTRKEFEQLLEEKYNEGYAEGKKVSKNSSLTGYCPYYWGCLNRTNWWYSTTTTPSITVSSTNSQGTITSNDFTQATLATDQKIKITPPKEEDK